MRFGSLSLGAKLNLALLAFLLVLGAATLAIVIYGFQRTQDDATERSQEALEEQGKLALQALAGGVADSGVLQFEAAGAIGQRASRYMQDSRATSGSTAVDTSDFERTGDGVVYDPNPARTSDVVVVNHSDLGGAVPDDITYSAALDRLFPALAEPFPGEIGGEAYRPIAIIFTSVNAVVRYYPPVGIHETTPAEVDVSVLYDRFGPQANPERVTIWTTPYEDLQGRGPVMTAQTPVYEGDTFRGILEVDLSIAQLITLINQLKPTPGGFTFYVDTAGEILETDAFDLLNREAGTNPQLAAILDTMKNTAPEPGVTVETVTLEGEDFFVAYTSMPLPGGSLAVAAPVDEVTEQAALITAGIEDEGNRTFLFIVVALATLYAAGLLAATYLNRRVIVGPIRELAAATRSVAAGDLKTRVDLGRSDELGTLGNSFNAMIEQLEYSEQRLEQRVEDRTRETTALLEVSRAVASSLDIRDVMNAVLEQLNTIIEHSGASVLLFKDDAFEFFGARSTAAPTARVGLRIPIEFGDFLWEPFGRGEPVIIEDIRADTKIAVKYRAAIGSIGMLDQPPFNIIRSWMAVPLIVRDASIGMLTLSWTEPSYFTGEHARLVRAFADQAATAIENARLYDESKQRAREFEALSRADTELFRSLDLDAVLQALVDVTVDVLGNEKSMVATWDEQTRHMTLRASRNISQRGLVMIREMYQRTSSNMDNPRIIATEDPADAHPEEAEVVSVEGLRSYIQVPVISPSGGALGFFSVGYTTEHTFSDDEHRLLSALADRAAVAVENADLYQKAQLAASLEERQRLARELHDSVSQALYGIALGARTARTQLERDPAKASEPLDYVLSLAEAGLAEMRALIFELRPESLETEGLVAAINKQASAVKARYGIDVKFDEPEEPEASLETKETAYRVAQEALHNVVKHSHARTVSIRLASENGSLALEIADDGTGFDPTADYAGHLGLKSMRERAERGGGTLDITSRPGSGAAVSLELPLHRG